MAHPETLLPMPEIEDPTQRFVSVVKFYLSGWHIKPPYVSFSRYEKHVGTSGSRQMQGREKTSQSDSGRDLHLLLGLSRSYSRILHIRANFTSPSKIQLLFHGT